MRSKLLLKRMQKKACQCHICLTSKVLFDGVCRLLCYIIYSFSPSHAISPGAKAERFSHSGVDESVSKCNDVSISVLSRSNHTNHDVHTSFTNRSSSIVGTLEYMAPEIIILFGRRKLHRAGYTGAVDFWSLGIMIYKMLTGLEPFKRFSYDAVRTILPAHLSKYSGYRYAFDALFGVVNYDIYDGLLNENTRNIIQALLEFHDDQRLGFALNNLEAAHDKLKQHPFFASIDWALLEAKQLPPPYVPTNEILDSMKEEQFKVKSLCELLKEANKNQWCEEFEHPNVQSPTASSPHSRKHNALEIPESDEYYFRSWNYINPSLMSNLSM